MPSRAWRVLKRLTRLGRYTFPELLASFRHAPLLAIHGTVIRQRLARGGLKESGLTPGYPEFFPQPPVK
jgi:hypothetical protein